MLKKTNILFSQHINTRVHTGNCQKDLEQNAKNFNVRFLRAQQFIEKHSPQELDKSAEPFNDFCFSAVTQEPSIYSGQRWRE